jgi:hypothetical protein
MIGFNTFSSASGLAFAISAQSQVEDMSTDWEKSPDGPDTTHSAPPAISSRVSPVEISDASDESVTQTTARHQFDHVESKPAKQAARFEARGVLKAASRQFHDIYQYVLRSGSLGKSAPATIK